MCPDGNGTMRERVQRLWSARIHPEYACINYRQRVRKEKVDDEAARAVTVCKNRKTRDEALYICGRCSQLRSAVTLTNLVETLKSVDHLSPLEKGKNMKEAVEMTVICRIAES